MMYLHVLNRGGLGVRSPFDRLWTAERCVSRGSLRPTASRAPHLFRVQLIPVTAIVWFGRQTAFPRSLQPAAATPALAANCGEPTPPAIADRVLIFRHIDATLQGGVSSMAARATLDRCCGAHTLCR